MKYHWYHFTGTDYNAAGNDGKGETGIFRILGDGKSFARDVDTEKGNFGKWRLLSYSIIFPFYVAPYTDWQK